MHFDAEFFVALGFLLFVLLLGYLGVHTRVAAELDRRATQVTNELAEARRLRDEAERVVRGIEGVRYVTNEIVVDAPPVTPVHLRQTIEQALARRAARTTSHVRVAVDGDTVTLEGEVASWLERRAVLGAARGTPGVKHVEDHLVFA